MRAKSFHINVLIEVNLSIMGESIDRLYAAVLAARGGDPAISRTSKLFQDGIAKMAKKLAEEAVEVGLDAVQARRDRVVLESADLLYNLCVLWAACGIEPGEVEHELDRRERVYGIAEKLPKDKASIVPSTRMRQAT
jgi:phosphoribosyl-ATP pyrophosphohydrolase